MANLRELFKRKSKDREAKSRPTVREIFSGKSSRNGAMSMGMIALVVCIVIVINLIVSQLPENIRDIDLTDNRLYQISEVSEELLDNLEYDIDITVLAVKDSTDDRIRTFISRYASCSSRLHVEWIDPVQHPSALETYGVTSNTIVVSCEETDKSTTVSFDDILVMDTYSYYYGSTSYTEFDGEGQLTSAVNYVTSSSSQVIYQTTGHGEATFSDSVTDLFSKSNLTVNDLNLLMESEIPEDCDLLIMYAPTTDLSEDEAQVVRDYLDAGGNVYMILGAEEGDLPNLQGILEEYGLTLTDGYIADTERCYQGNYYYIFPNLSVSGDLADNISSEMVLLINSKGLTTLDEVDEDISIDSFMTTSSQAVAVTEEETSDAQTFTLGAIVTKSLGSDDSDSDSSDDSDSDSDSDYDSVTEDIDDMADEEEEQEQDTEARLTVITGYYMIDEEVTSSFSTLENLTLFMNSVTANLEGVQNLSIESKSLEVTYNTMQYTGMISLAVVIGIPVIVIIIGFVVWFRRRKA